MTAKKVIVFSTPTCSWCIKVKDYLKKNGVPYREVDVSRDPKAAQDMVRKTGQQGVPQIWVGSTAVVGFNKEKLDRLLELG
jgi:glutaredoxin 3